MKTVFITGSSGGLGAELAIEFSKQYRVILHGRDEFKLKYVASCVKTASGQDCPMILGDITNKKTIDAIERLVKGEGLDILINNAGVYENSPLTTEENLRKVMDVNFFAPVVLTSRLLPYFIQKQKGLIVNINSIAGKQGSTGESAYAASKHALKGFFDSLRLDVTKQGVRILDVYLGAMRTPMSAERKNQELLIDPKEAAKVIVKNCELYESLAVNEINIGRIKYAI